MISLSLFCARFACFLGDILIPSSWKREGVDDGCCASWSVQSSAEFELEKLEVSYKNDCGFPDIENTRGQTIVCRINRQAVFSECDAFLLTAKTDQTLG